LLRHACNGLIPMSYNSFNRQHPELVRLREKQRDFAMALDILAKKQRKLLSGTVLSFGDVYRNDNMNAERQAQDIDRNNSKALGRPMDVIACVKNAIRLMPQLLSITEEHFESVVLELNPLIGHIFPTRTKNENKQAKPHSWNEFKGGMEAKCKEILLRFKIVLENSLFSVLDAEKLLMDWRESGLEFKRREALIRDALVNQATLRMSTIGSSHQLIMKNEKNDEPEPLDMFSALSLKEDPNDRETVVIFDEAGCIPAYELLGISRLTSQVKSLVLVGDVHQLPPYDPSSGQSKTRGSKEKGSSWQHQKENVKSLLSVSKLTIDHAKIQLSIQYRVPRDIAQLLNARIYNGQYNTPVAANVPIQGFHFIHVPYMENKKRKYVNDNEVENVIQLVNQSIKGRQESIMILTPVSKNGLPDPF